MSGEEPKVTVEVNDPAADLAKARREEAAKAAAEARSAYVSGLQNELGYLERQPVPNEKRIAQVKGELDRYSREPKAPKIETAAAVTVAPDAGPEAPAADTAAKKTAAKRAPAKRAAAKKTAAK